MKMLFITVLAGIAVSMASCNNRNAANNGQGTEASANSADSTRSPVISFASTTYDFGKIKEGEKVAHNFTFTNKGKSPLIISNASASCGCTVPDYPHEPIAPGESSEIKVVFNSTGKSGMQNKVVTLTSNALPSTSQIFLTGEVQSLTK